MSGFHNVDDMPGGSYGSMIVDFVYFSNSCRMGLVDDRLVTQYRNLKTNVWETSFRDPPGYTMKDLATVKDLHGTIP